ncbi:hypothetical protein D8B26_006548 [Coccidioides posadasii str. Silveira]|uniref:uncharacterized protein n=1 Tax=Coccidioides posadasii (strain RMSCC 757 / Silveira) TaxID=443226 RepID=UPI001BF0F8C2|nr:hypothetical protein D8B26_006548 [Coccidioides posadasii str. Silveira]
MAHVVHLIPRPRSVQIDDWQLRNMTVFHKEKDLAMCLTLSLLYLWALSPSIGPRRRVERCMKVEKGPSADLAQITGIALLQAEISLRSCAVCKNGHIGYSMDSLGKDPEMTLFLPIVVVL